jgi:hypothetical protein
MAGLPQEVIDLAKRKSEEFVGNMKGVKKVNQVQKQI